MSFFKQNGLFINYKTRHFLFFLNSYLDESVLNNT